MTTLPGADAPVFLIGFMASGKTTVGRILAAKLRWRFLDLDGVITDAAGLSVEQIFAREGEAGFRARESEALRQAAASPRAVVATGGGAACVEPNLALMLASGRVVTLLVAPGDAVRRAGPASGRPLLAPAAGAADPLAAAFRLLAAREPFYARAHHRVETSGKSPEDVADEVLRLLDADPR
ncbi:MAG: shikimate kinase [Pseudomonadota bacterium]